MYQPIAIINDEVGNFVGLRCATFDVQGANYDGINFSSLTDFNLNASQLTNFNIVDLDIPTLCKYAYVDKTAIYTNTKALPHNLQMAVLGDIDNAANSAAIKLWLTGVHDITHIDTNGKPIRRSSNNGDATIVFQVVGPRVLEDARGYQRHIVCPSLVVNPSGKYATDYLVIAPTGACKILSYDDLYSTVSAGKLVLGNIIGIPSKTNRTIDAYLNVNPVSASGTIFMHSHVAALGAMALVNFSFDHDTVVNVPDIPELVIPSAVTKMNCSVTSPTLKGIKFPTELLSADTHILFKTANELDELYCPKRLTGIFVVLARSAKRFSVPRELQNAFFGMSFKELPVKTLDLTTLGGGEARVSLGAAELLEHVALSTRTTLFPNSSSNYNYGFSDSCHFKAHSLKLLKQIDVTNSIITGRNCLSLGLADLAQPVVTIQIDRPISALRLFYSTESKKSVEIRIKHSGIRHAYIFFNSRYHGVDNCRQIVFEKLTNNPVEGVSVASKGAWGTDRLEYAGNNFPSKLKFNGQSVPKISLVDMPYESMS